MNVKAFLTIAASVSAFSSQPLLCCGFSFLCCSLFLATSLSLSLRLSFVFLCQSKNVISEYILGKFGEGSVLFQCSKSLIDGISSSVSD